MSGRRNTHAGRRAVTPGRGAGTLAAGLLLVSSLGAPGCYTEQMTLVKSGLDSLRMQVDRITLQDSISARTLADTRKELADQRDLLLATRATSSSTSRETGETLGRLEGKLDDIMARFRIVSERQSAPRQAESAPSTATPATGSPTAAGGGSAPATGSSPPATGKPAGSGPDPTQLYDQATEDLTQGRYAMALGNYRQYLQRFPDTDLADNAQYGVGECFFAQAQFDSALVEYARVGARWGTGDRAPAALYKVGLCEERMGRAADSKKTFEDLVKRFPQSGESQLARDRLASKH
ncbi:MAG TPA: tol-pal system protein YbgF [Candidatus Eisenbacteria bacterium]|jgi:tol-pal system protein YbgF